MVRKRQSFDDGMRESRAREGVTGIMDVLIRPVFITLALYLLISLVLAMLSFSAFTFSAWLSLLKSGRASEASVEGNSSG